MSGYEWLVPVALGTLICGGMVALGLLAHHGFSTITKTQENHGRDIKAIVRAVDACVTWDDLGKELGPVKSTVQDHADRLTRVETRCEEHHK